MNRKFIVSALLSLGILAGMVALFPAVWVLLLASLLVLISAQVVLVRRHLHVTGPAGAAKAPLLKATRSPAAQTVPSPGAAVAALTGAVEAAAGKENPGAEGNLPFDGDVFSRFREHLESAERTEGAPRGAALAGAGEPEAQETVRDQVRLSTSTAHRPAARPPATQAANTKAAAPETAPALPAHPRLNLTVSESDEEVSDLFSDLVPEPIASARPAPLTAKPATASDEQAGAAGSSAAAADASREPGDGMDSAVDLGAEIAALAKLAEDALNQEDRAGTKAALSQAFSLADGLAEGAPWTLHRAAARAAAHNGEPEALIAHFESMLKAGAAPDLSTVPSLVTRLLDTLEGEQRHGTEVSLLMRLLAQFRQSGDRPAMDALYGMIEAAQEQVGDERKLLQYLKNHLEIRKVLADREGQLELIDQIGNRCYKLGLTEEAQHYYELGLRLRNAPQASPEEEAPSAPDSGATDSEDAGDPAESALPASANSGRSAG